MNVSVLLPRVNLKNDVMQYLNRCFLFDRRKKFLDSGIFFQFSLNLYHQLQGRISEFSRISISPTLLNDKIIPIIKMVLRMYCTILLNRKRLVTNVYKHNTLNFRSYRCAFANHQNNLCTFYSALRYWTRDLLTSGLLWLQLFLLQFHPTVHKPKRNVKYCNIF